MKKPIKPARPRKNQTPPSEVHIEDFLLLDDRDRGTLILRPYFSYEDEKIIEWAKSIHNERLKLGFDQDWKEIMFDVDFPVNEYIWDISVVCDFFHKNDLMKLIEYFDNDSAVIDWNLYYDSIFSSFGVSVSRRKPKVQFENEMKEYEKRFESYEKSLQDWMRKMGEYEEWKKTEEIRKLEAKLKKLKK